MEHEESAAHLDEVERHLLGAIDFHAGRGNSDRAAELAQRLVEYRRAYK